MYSSAVLSAWAALKRSPTFVPMWQLNGCQHKKSTSDTLSLAAKVWQSIHKTHHPAPSLINQLYLAEGVTRSCSNPSDGVREWLHAKWETVSSKKLTANECGSLGRPESQVSLSALNEATKLTDSERQLLKSNIAKVITLKKSQQSVNICVWYLTLAYIRHSNTTYHNHKCKLNQNHNCVTVCNWLAQWFCNQNDTSCCLHCSKQVT